MIESLNKRLSYLSAGAIVRLAVPTQQDELSSTAVKNFAPRETNRAVRKEGAWKVGRDMPHCKGKWKYSGAAMALCRNTGPTPAVDKSLYDTRCWS